VICHNLPRGCKAINEYRNCERTHEIFCEQWFRSEKLTSNEQRNSFKENKNYRFRIVNDCMNFIDCFLLLNKRFIE